MICPKDGKPCCDDLCYGGGCLYGGGPNFPLCPACGSTVDDLGECPLCDDDTDES